MDGRGFLVKINVGFITVPKLYWILKDGWNMTPTSSSWMFVPWLLETLFTLLHNKCSLSSSETHKLRLDLLFHTEDENMSSCWTKSCLDEFLYRLKIWQLVHWCTINIKLAERWHGNSENGLRYISPTKTLLWP